MTQEILFEVRNRIGFITLNRPAALNALSFNMLCAMRRQLQTWEHDTSINAVLVEGSGEKAFCAGGDIRALHDSIKGGSPLKDDYFIEEYQLDYYTHVYPKPYIAVMNGITMGGGMGIAQGAKHRLVGARTRVAMPETAIGLFPDVGGSYFLSRLPGGLGTYLGLTGTQIRAADTLYAGLADMYLAPDAAATLNHALADLQWTDTPATDIATLLRKSATQPEASATLPSVRKAIDEHFTKPNVPDILASLRSETRSEYRDWAHATLDLLNKRSPLMLLVTLRELQLGKSKSLADCLRMELEMVHRSVREHDLAEGIRALNVDKDNNPRWEHRSVEDVPRERVDAFFKGPWTPATHPFAALGG